MPDPKERETYQPGEEPDEEEIDTTVEEPSDEKASEELGEKVAPSEEKETKDEEPKPQHFQLGGKSVTADELIHEHNLAQVKAMNLEEENRQLREAAIGGDKAPVSEPAAPGPGAQRFLTEADVEHLVNKVAEKFAHIENNKTAKEQAAEETKQARDFIVDLETKTGKKIPQDVIKAAITLADVQPLGRKVPSFRRELKGMLEEIGYYDNPAQTRKKIEETAKKKFEGALPTKGGGAANPKPKPEDKKSRRLEAALEGADEYEDDEFFS